MSDSGVTLSDLLSLMELRGRDWCYVDVTADGGFSVPASGDVMVHAVLQGAVRLAGSGHEAMELVAGDVVFLLSGEAHAVRDRPESPAPVLPFLREDQRLDIAPIRTVGTGRNFVARLLSGRLRLAWPEGGRLDLPARTRLGREAEDGDLELTSSRVRRLASCGLEPGGTAYLTKMASVMLAQALRHDPAWIAGLEAGHDASPVARALRLMTSDPAAGWSVQRLARHVGMGRSSFAARFRDEVGRPPMEILTERRLQLAAKLLEEGELKVHEISRRVGYLSESAFTRRFSQRFGVPPGRMRKDQARRASERQPAAPAVFSLAIAASS